MGYGCVETLDMFAGHSKGIRSIELSKDNQTLISGCEDHSLRIWDFNTCKSRNILVGHLDVVVSSIYFIIF
jgi:WD40 repeat protein